MKNQIEKIKGTWTYNHKQLIVILSLLLALVIQVHADDIRAWHEGAATIEVRNMVTVSCDIKCHQLQWIDLRAEQIMDELRDSHEREARYMALLELNKMSQDIAAEYRGATE